MTGNKNKGKKVHLDEETRVELLKLVGEFASTKTDEDMAKAAKRLSEKLEEISERKEH